MVNLGFKENMGGRRRFFLKFTSVTGFTDCDIKGPTILILAETQNERECGCAATLQVAPLRLTSHMILGAVQHVCGVDELIAGSPDPQLGLGVPEHYLPPAHTEKQQTSLSTCSNGHQ